MATLSEHAQVPRKRTPAGANSVNNILSIENELNKIWRDFYRARDLRWMFSFAHYRSTHLLRINPGEFYAPDALFEMNNQFAKAFIVAAQSAQGPWKEAFAQCQAVGAAEVEMRTACLRTAPVLPLPKICAGAMAKVHINIDLANALRSVGCGDVTDFGNVLVFVEQAACEALEIADGGLKGPIYCELKKLLLPLDREWRNAVYKAQCGVPVPRPELAFRVHVVIDPHPKPPAPD